MEAKMSGPLNWIHKISEISDTGFCRTREANSEERKRLSAMLDLIDCSHLVAQYSIQSSTSDGWTLSGILQAKVVQSCIVSLEPVEADLSEPFHVDFREVSLRHAPIPGEHNILAAEEVEILLNDQIDVGRIIYETLAGALNPYPRKEGAEFSWSASQLNPQTSNTNPFFILKKFKPDA